MTWEILGDDSVLGLGQYVQDLGPYTGPWPPGPTAIRVGTDPRLTAIGASQINLIVGPLNPNGLLTEFGYDTYPGDFTALFRQVSPGPGAHTGTQTGPPVFTSTTGGAGDFSAPPPGAHLIVGVFSADPPGALSAADLAPAGYTATASGPGLPAQQGQWSDWRPVAEQAGGVFVGRSGTLSQSFDNSHFAQNLAGPPYVTPDDQDVAAMVAAQWALAKAGANLNFSGSPQVGTQWGTEKSFNARFNFTGYSNGSLGNLSFMGQVVGFLGTDPTPDGFPDEMLDLDELLDYLLPTPVDGYSNINIVQYETPTGQAEVKAWTGTAQIIESVNYNQYSDQNDGVGTVLGPAEGCPNPVPNWTRNTYRVGKTHTLPPFGWLSYGAGDFFATMTPLPAGTTPNVHGQVFSNPGSTSVDVDAAAAMGTHATAWFPIQADSLDVDTLTPVNYSYPPNGQAYHQLAWQYSDIVVDAGDAAATLLIPRWRYLKIGNRSALRLAQRNDGLGTVGHARLNTTSNTASSTQRSRAPRVGQPNRYT